MSLAVCRPRCRGSRGPVSQASAGRVHHGNTQVRSRSAAWCGEPVGDLVLVDVEVLGQVDHRLHRHRGARDGRTRRGPGRRRRSERVFATRARCNFGRPGAVIASSERWTCSTTCRPESGAGVGLGVGGGVEVQRQLVPGHLPERFGAAHVQRRGRAEVGEPGGADRERGVQVQGVGEVDLGLAPTRCPRRTPDGCARATCRPSAAASRRRRASSGMNRTIASSTSRSTPLGRIRCANPATCASTNPAAAGLRARWWRGRSAGPATPAGHRPGPGPRSAGAGAAARGPHRGRPCRSRWAARPRPRTRPQQNSATSGAPGPATGTGVSPNRTASPIDSAGCRSAQAQAAPEQVGLGGVRGGTAVPGEREHPGSGVRCGVEVGCRVVMAPF